MSYLEKLLDGGEVEWKPLGEVTNILRGKRLVKSELEDSGKYAVFQNSMTPLGYYHEFNVKADTTFIISAGAAGEIGYSNVDFWAADDVFYFLVPEKLENKFLYYYLLTQQTKITGQVRRASVPRLSRTAFEKMLVPIPCPDNPKKSLEIQQKIVAILDTFAELTAELTAELSARKQQYSYYREELLRFKEGEAEWKSLGEVALIGTGSHDTQDAIDDGDYIFYARGIAPLKLNSFDFDETAIITAGDGVGVGKVFHWAVGKYALHQRAYRIVPNENEIYPRYVYHYIVANFYSYIEKTSVSSSVTSMRKPMFLKFPIPVPTLQEQERIVSILDKFDTLTTSISEGLPKEIALRKKQYEYYREMLLTFPKDNLVA